MFNINTLSAVFGFEWKSLCRNSFLTTGLLGFILISYYAFYTGHQVIQKQRVAIDHIKQLYSQDFNAALNNFTDTLTPRKKAKAAVAGRPDMIGFRFPQNAIDPPNPLAEMATGQREINPYYFQIRSDADLLDTSNVDISNPLKLLAGTLDLAFVLVYLLPLLAIIFSYNVFSSEKEQGTYTLLALQVPNVKSIIKAKLLFRFLLLWLMTIFVIISGLSFFGLWPKIDEVRAVSFLFIATGYIFFWFAVSYAAVSLRCSSSLTAIMMIGAWLLFLIVLPNLYNSYTVIKYPVPLRADLVSYQRQASEEIWTMNPNALADSFTRYNPKFLSLINVKTDTGKSSKRFLCGYYDLLERRVRRRATLLSSAIEARNSALKSFNVYSPAVQTQYLFSVISSTTRSDYKRFENEVSDYQLIWRDYIYSHQFRDIYFKPEDFYEFPQFSPARPAFQFCQVLIPSISLWISGLLFLIIPFTIKNKKY